MESFLLAVTILTDPAETFYMVRLNRKKKFSYIPPTVLLLLFFAVRILQIYGTHYPLASVNVSDADIVVEIGKFIVPIISWVVANYAVTSLMNGESLPREVYLSTTLCLMPYIVFTPIVTAASHVMSAADASIFNALNIIIWAWIIILLFWQTMAINDYTLGKCFAVTLLSLIAVVILWVIAILIFSLAQQFIQFLVDIYTEFRINFL